MFHGRVRSITIAVMVISAFALSACSGGAVPLAASRTSAMPSLQSAATHAAPSTARHWTLFAGANARNGALQALDFFYDSITIDEGDSVTWTVGGNAHTVTFFGPRTRPIAPALAPHGGSTYDGHVYDSSGIMFPGQTYTLTFTKAGTYAYECLLHDPEMAGMVIVQPRGTPYPHDQAFYTQHGAAEAARELAEAYGSLTEFPYPDRGTKIAAGIAPGLAAGTPSHSTVVRFLNADALDSGTVRIHKGTTLTWYNLSNNEPHTVTFPKAGSPAPTFSPFTPAYGGNVYDGSHTVHSGPLFPGQSFSITFAKSGTFEYYCLFHDFEGMEGEIIVN